MPNFVTISKTYIVCSEKVSRENVQVNTDTIQRISPARCGKFIVRFVDGSSIFIDENDRIKLAGANLTEQVQIFKGLING